MKFEFVDEKEKYHAKIKVFGIGGAGCNAVSNMIAAKLKGVEFISANTDNQALERSNCTHKIQLGINKTKGLGAGADPSIGEESAEESVSEITEAVSESDMVFITAGMGGGTGTGASPIVARQARESEALTVAIVTKPFHFEGKKRMDRALAGIDKLKQEVDTLIIIPNERLKSIGGKNTSFKDLITRADEILLNAVRGISDLIMSNGFINLDFADVKKVMEQMGTAIMGTGRANGENRAAEAAKEAINSPLLEDISIKGAKGLLMNVTGPGDMTMEEVDEASSLIKEEVDKDAEIFWGMVFDDDMGEDIQITVIATGIDKGGVMGKVVKLREITPEEAGDPWTVRLNGENLEHLDTPTFQRLEQDEALAMKTEVLEEPSKRSIFKRPFFKDNLDYPTFLRAKAD